MWDTAALLLVAGGVFLLAQTGKSRWQKIKPGNKESLVQDLGMGIDVLGQRIAMFMEVPARDAMPGRTSMTHNH